MFFWPVLASSLGFALFQGKKYHGLPNRTQLDERDERLGPKAAKQESRARSSIEIKEFSWHR